MLGLPGYTVVEVMIFLAVSGALVVAVMGTFSRQQGRTQFSTAVRETESRLQDVINDVSTGYYTSSNNFSCTDDSGRPLIDASAPAAQGTNAECIFIGRVLQFNMLGLAGSRYNNYTVVGVRQYGPSFDRRDVPNLSEAKPAIAHPVTERLDLPGGASVARMTYTNGAGTTDIDAVGFFSSFGPAAGQSSGSLTVNVLPIDAPTNIEGDMGGAVEALNASSVKDPSGGVQLCINSGTSSQHAVLVIGSNNRQLTTDATIGDGAC